MTGNEYRKALKTHVNRTYGIDLDMVNTHHFETPKDRFSAWVCESIAEGFRYLDEYKEPWVALRCLCQAKEYMGRLGGFHPNTQVADAITSLQTELERALRGV